ncbi:MAG: pyridine nucleotide-disulfide oxidoreductase [Alphaproteobacteria bacterium]|nr:pyridine nucleotide-disulfide oxidoreductase [Alphaproteobacteria bacterium]
MQIAASAREAGYAEPIRLVSEEPVLPYQRPPLSKGYLTGKFTPAALPLRAEAFYRDNRIETLLGQRAESLDLAARRVSLAGGGSLAFDRLALATGTRPRPLPLPGADLDGVLFLRSLADADRLRERLGGAGSIVVIGGGFIGLELASVAAAMGKPVVIVEAQERLLARGVSPQIAAFLADVHRSRGVALRLRSTVRDIRGANGRVQSVVCGDGETLAADLVLIAIGVVPNTELAGRAGLACQDGLVVDRFARTTDPLVVAAGDCTRHPSAFAGQLLRLESVQNAIDQAKTAGATLAGQEKPYESVPWFWSDQYELKLQMVGLVQGSDRHAVRGSLEQRRFSIFYFRSGRLVAIDSVNRAADHMLGRKLLALGRSPTPQQAADESFDLQTLVAA